MNKFDKIITLLLRIAIAGFMVRAVHYHRWDEAIFWLLAAIADILYDIRRYVKANPNLVLEE